MKFSSVILTSVLSLLATATPIELDSRAVCKKTDQLATFQDLTALPALSQINPIGTYKGLQYRSFNLLQVGLLGAIPPPVGINPPSPFNVAANSITGTILTGSPAFIASSVKSFDIYSTYIACVANTALSVAGLPTQCTISFTAYKKDKTTVFDTVNAQFNPTGLLSDMYKVVFPSSWTDLRQVDIAIVQATLTSTLSALFIDDVKYKTCS
ncbi:hypothetical protein GLAREA_06337 [Glarea lozoyensis ATCC 20868]|uniref:Uncharacterized protein n=2 Tax=Glarea lozoyensis TaxID=101852 RepID=S3D6G9_GLAL2|nr:uncharacterized protein GLAREA_06337 [Glarea lozoyensis ATCC 20868]EHK97891.1 hypothetical protein M7I_6390 [Glarea lozoyensis 74030]EPE33325.1 hypothetical protein GLAREA_06337 [Glarea lozoyensis ATCC 20868]